MYMEVEKQWKMGMGKPGLILNGREVDLGKLGEREGWYSNMYKLSLKSTFLPVEMSSFEV